MITFFAIATLGLQTVVSGTVTSNSKPVRDAVVWLKGSGPVKPAKASIEQKDKTFVPHVLVVSVGSTVDFPNRDDLFHNVFAEYQAKKFDLGMYPRGQTRKVTFDKAGVVSVLCNVHAEMSAYVVVVDASHFTKTDKQGKFRLEGVPNGSYTLEAWHESRKTYSQRLVVTGADLSVDIALKKD